MDTSEVCHVRLNKHLIQSGPIHVDGGANREDKPDQKENLSKFLPSFHFVTKFSSVSLCNRPWNPAVNFVLLLQRIDGDWKSGGAGSCSKRRHYCVPHVRNEPGGREWGQICGIKGGNLAILKEENTSLTWKAGNGWQVQRGREERGSRGWRAREGRWRSNNQVWQIHQQHPRINITITMMTLSLSGSGWW